jgi:hypothetical protein
MTDAGKRQYSIFADSHRDVTAVVESTRGNATRAVITFLGVNPGWVATGYDAREARDLPLTAPG